MASLLCHLMFFSAWVDGATTMKTGKQKPIRFCKRSMCLTLSSLSQKEIVIVLSFVRKHENKAIPWEKEDKNCSVPVTFTVFP